MKINEDLAKYIAVQALAEPYMQSPVMDTGQFARFIKNHGIDLSWQALHQFAEVGVLHPILVFESVASTDPSRYVEVDVGFVTATYVDLGRSVEAEELKPVSFFDGLASSVVMEMKWHPFQLWEVAQVARRLELRIALDGSLAGIENYQKTVERLLSAVRPSLTKFAGDPRHVEFIRVLGVLLAVEPLVITSVDSRVKLIRMSSLPFSMGV